MQRMYKSQHQQQFLLLTRQVVDHPRRMPPRKLFPHGHLRLLLRGVYACAPDRNGGKWEKQENHEHRRLEAKINDPRGRENSRCCH